MIPLEQARQLVLDGCTVNEPRVVPVREAIGCVLTDDIVATEAIPPFANTAMDGYAVRAEDTVDAPVRLLIVDSLAAGRAPEHIVGSGEAIRIMTGAPMPDGADAVVMVEDTSIEGDRVVINTVAGPGQFIRAVGDDVQIGDTVLVAGTELRPAHLGVLASLGRLQVTVHPRLRVGVLSSGDELVEDGSPLKPGQIREANKELLLGLVAAANCTPVDLGLVIDTEEALLSAFERAIASCDAVITSGGVSMGDYDLVKVVLRKLGKMEWMQMAIQPAKPFAFGLIGDEASPTPVFGLPGNPVSSMVSFELMARPALRKIMGHSTLDRPMVLAIADNGLRRRAGDGKVNWQRVTGTFGPDGRFHVVSTGAQGSHQLANSAAANGLARLEDGPGIEPGAEVPVLLLG